MSLTTEATLISAVHEVGTSTDSAQNDQAGTCAQSHGEPSFCGDTTRCRICAEDDGRCMPCWDRHDGGTCSACDVVREDRGETDSPWSDHGVRDDSSPATVWGGTGRSVGGY